MPVKQYAANGYGLYDMAGNAWEWCKDLYGSGYYQTVVDEGAVVRNPQKPGDSYDPAEPDQKKKYKEAVLFFALINIVRVIWSVHVVKVNTGLLPIMLVFDA